MERDHSRLAETERFLITGNGHPELTEPDFV